jgi:hypothetical protein
MFTGLAGTGHHYYWIDTQAERLRVWLQPQGGPSLTAQGVGLLTRARTDVSRSRHCHAGEEVSP